MENEDRLDRLDAMICEGRLLRGTWTDGRERACLLAALSPECGKAKSPDACPATVMPAWLAELTPWMDDAGSTGAWPGMVRRYAGLARRWHVLDAAAWRRLDYASRAIAVREARSHVVRVAPSDPVLLAIDGVLALLEREHVDPAAARAAADAAAADAARARADAAAAWAAAAWAARTATRSPRAAVAARARADAAAWAAEAAWAAAAWAAHEAAAGSAAAATAATWAAGAASAASADRITDAILDAIEREIAAAE